MLPGSRALGTGLTIREARQRALHLRMQDWILSTIGLLGCAFLIYVFFHWLRDELNPKSRRRPGVREMHGADDGRPFIVRSHRNHI
jgi:threonine/homoserine/homoserine lactone efflux protein